MAQINGIQKMTWQHFTSIPNGTRVLNYYFDQCVALANLYSQGVIGANFVPVNSAWQWWDHFWNYPTLHQNYVQSSKPVAGAIFVSRYGIYNAPDGHIGVVTSVNSNGTFNTIEQNAGTWRYVGRYTRGYQNMLGFLIPKNNPAVKKLKENQRQVGASFVKRRAGATTKSKEKSPSLRPYEAPPFAGWTQGEKVSSGGVTSRVWFRGYSGDYFWAGAFTSQSTKGLKLFLEPSQRQVAKNPVKRRAAASTNGKEKSPALKPGEIAHFAGYVKGEKVSQGGKTTDVWYKGFSGDYFWAGGFTTVTTVGLKNLTPTIMTPRQRKVGNNPVQRRSEPNTRLAPKQPALRPGEIPNFQYWTEGEMVTQGGISSNLWYQGYSGDFFWAGGFTTQSKKGLSESPWSKINLKRF